MECLARTTTKARDSVGGRKAIMTVRRRTRNKQEEAQGKKQRSTTRLPKQVNRKKRRATRVVEYIFTCSLLQCRRFAKADTLTAPTINRSYLYRTTDEDEVGIRIVADAALVVVIADVWSACAIGAKTNVLLRLMETAQKLMRMSKRRRQNQNLAQEVSNQAERTVQLNPVELLWIMIEEKQQSNSWNARYIAISMNFSSHIRMIEECKKMIQIMTFHRHRTELPYIPRTNISCHRREDRLVPYSQSFENCSDLILQLFGFHVSLLFLVGSFCRGAMEQRNFELFLFRDSVERQRKFRDSRCWWAWIRITQSSAELQRLSVMITVTVRAHGIFPDVVEEFSS